jgi:hypothetical protein
MRFPFGLGVSLAPEKVASYHDIIFHAVVFVGITISVESND